MAKIKMTLVWKSEKFEPKFDVIGLTEDDEISFKVVTDKGEATTFKLKFDKTPSAISVPEITTSDFQKLKPCESESEFQCEADGKRGGAQLPPVGGRAKK
jgi:hypothetical protein